MKKKKLEALPPFPLRECNKKPYKMVANEVVLAGEKHLLCDVYEKADKEYRFRMRAAYTDGDWALGDRKMGQRIHRERSMEACI